MHRLLAHGASQIYDDNNEDETYQFLFKFINK